MSSRTKPRNLEPCDIRSLGFARDDKLKRFSIVLKKSMDFQSIVVELVGIINFIVDSNYLDKISILIRCLNNRMTYYPVNKLDNLLLNSWAISLFTGAIMLVMVIIISCAAPSLYSLFFSSI